MTASSSPTDRALDLHEYCVRNAPATFFVRASGDSMVDAGIASGDLLVVDRSIEARTGHIVIASIADELTVKQLRVDGKRVILEPANDAYSAIEAEPGRDLSVWGVVTYIIKTVLEAV